MKNAFVMAGILALSLNFSCAPSRAQSLSASIGDKPAIEAVVASDAAEGRAGWQWRWNENEGRRDVGQTFTAPRDFTLDKILLRIESGAKPGVANAPFTLSIYRFADAKSLEPGAQIAEHKGTLPANTLDYRGGQWLEFDVPEIALKNGETYGFVLSFAANKAADQGVVFSISPRDAYAGGQGIYSTDGLNWKAQGDFQFLLLDKDAVPQTPMVTAPVAAKVLVVDRNNGPLKTLAQASAQARPGDTIRLAPGSGPYREELWVKTSGTASAPITIDGGDNLITGFEPLTNWQQKEGVWTCQLPVAFPCVLTYNGERLVQDATTKQFTKYALLSDDKTTLTLQADVKTTGWEISTRDFAVRIQSSSFQIYKNLRASGSRNDGFNLHGKGEGLVFENVEGFNNLDEGYSAHDDIKSTVRGGKFWGNDNGIGNIANSATTLENVDAYDNLGFGVWFQDCSGTLKNVRAWNNGALQVYLLKVQAQIENVRGYTPTFTARPWVSYKESEKVGFGRQVIVKESAIAGHEVVLENANAPANP